MHFNFNSNSDEEECDYPFFTNQTNHLTLEAMNTFNNEYLNTIYYDNMSLPKSNQPPRRTAQQKLFSVQSTEKTATETKTLEMLNDKQTLPSSVTDNKLVFFKTANYQEMNKDAMKALTAKKWRLKQKEMATALKDTVKSLQAQKSSLEKMDKETLLLKQFLIKTQPAQLKDINAPLYAEEATTIKDLINTIAKQVHDNRHAKSRNHLKGSYLHQVMKLLQGYETFAQQLAKLKECDY